MFRDPYGTLLLSLCCPFVVSISVSAYTIIKIDAKPRFFLYLKDNQYFCKIDFLLHVLTEPSVSKTSFLSTKFFRTFNIFNYTYSKNV